MQEKYTPQRVAAILRGDTDDADEVIDVSQALTKLPPKYLIILTAYSHGMSPQEAGSGIVGSPKREYVRALRMVTRLLNGEDDVPAR